MEYAWIFDVQGNPGDGSAHRNGRAVKRQRRKTTSTNCPTINPAIAGFAVGVQGDRRIVRRLQHRPSTASQAAGRVCGDKKDLDEVSSQEGSCRNRCACRSSEVFRQTGPRAVGAQLFKPRVRIDSSSNLATESRSLIGGFSQYR